MQRSSSPPAAQLSGRMSNGDWSPHGGQAWMSTQQDNSTSLLYGNFEELVATPVPSHLRFISASTSRQHSLKAEMGFINADVVQETPSFLGICDGVSEVQTLGISPDEFPKDLLQRVRESVEERDAEWLNEAVERSWPSSTGPRNSSWVLNILKDAYLETMKEGSTTLLMAVIEENNHLMTANLGDCCLLVLRRAPSQPQKLYIAFQTEPLRFEHNKPFQISRIEGISQEQIISVINSAGVAGFPTQHGDILVMGTDGVFDNLHDDDIVRIVEKTCPWVPQSNAQIPHQQQQPVWGSALQNLMPVPSVAQLGGAADAIVQDALKAVCVSKVDEATGQLKWPPGAKQTPSGLGGKADDTTVIVAAVVEVSDPSAHEDFFYKVHPSATRSARWRDHGCCGGFNPSSNASGCRCS